ncbi:hypothetical protein JTB14_011784 [Gonioctena quinquepunctata]|nr:hypothetical protein JTB14_011784 [Gonioctena quinquepunctata]
MEASSAKFGIPSNLKNSSDSNMWGSKDTQDTVEWVILPLFQQSDLQSKKDTFLTLDDSKRVDFVFDSIKDMSLYKELLSVPKIPKSNESSVHFRNIGNNFFNASNYKKALEMYTKSIMFAEIGSESLALAYGNRSAVLFAKNYYNECLEDIERALANDVPDRTKANLNLRKQKAEQLKQKQQPIRYYKPAPTLENKNPLISCASSSVEIKHNQKYGRHIVATEDIKVGDVISVEDSFVHMIHRECKYTHCHLCLELCYNMIPCENCIEALFCGKDCLNQAQSGYHKYECDFPPILRFPEILHIRMTLKGLDELQNKKEVETDGVFSSDSFKDIVSLETNESKRDFLNLAVPAIMACMGYNCLTNNPEFRTKYDVDPRILKKYLFKTYMISACNPFTIKKIRYDYMDIDSKRVGTAVYSFTSLFNHSCVPNCEFFHHGTHMVIRALANIPKGEQCCISYGTSFSTTDIHQRRTLLKRLYCFDCDCKACVNKWPTYDHLPLGKQYPVSFQKKTARNTFDNTKANRKLLKELLAEGAQLYKGLEKYEPCKNLLVLQNMFTEIYTYEGCTDVEF